MEHELKTKIIGKLDKMSFEHKFNGLERIKGLLIVSDNWEQKGFYTATVKKKRNVIRDYYKEQID